VDNTDYAGFNWHRWWYPAEQVVPLLDGLLAEPNSVERFVVGPAIDDLSHIAIGPNDLKASARHGGGGAGLLASPGETGTR